MPSSDKSSLPILDLLYADGPSPSYRDELMLFGQFDGIWGMEVMFSDQAEKETLHEPGEWAFVWVLDGRAIQDLLAYPNTNNKSNPRRIETTRNK